MCIYAGMSCVRVCMNMHMYMYMYACRPMYVCVFVCVIVWCVCVHGCVMCACVRLQAIYRTLSSDG